MQHRDEALLDIELEAFAVDGALEQSWGDGSVVAQRGEEGRDLLMTMQNFDEEPRAARRPAVPERRCRYHATPATNRSQRSIN